MCVKEVYLYFKTAGQVNTQQTLKAAYARAEALGINEMVVASTSGDTAFKALDIMKDMTLTAVALHGGLKKPFHNELPQEIRKKLQQKGVNVVMATHPLSGVERSLAKKYSGVYPVMIIADTLKRFGQGTKVAVEIAIMAADAGYLSGRDIVAVGGTSRGADTALVIKPQNQAGFFDLKIREVICKPSNF